MNLKRDILNHAKNYLKEIGHRFLDLQIADSWGNILNQFESIHSHCHPNSYISGTFYLTEGSSIHFESPLQEIKSMKPKKNYSENYRTWDSYAIKPQEGLLIIFPSWLNHTVSPATQNERVSIAFNILPKGMFGSPSARVNFI